MKKKMAFLVSLLVIVMIAAGAGFYLSKNKQTEEVATVAPVKVVNKNIPTFFFHGYGSSYHAEAKMTAAIQQAHASNIIVRDMVDKKGRDKLIGQIGCHAKNPLVKVGFIDNRLRSAHGSYTRAYYSTGSRYVRNAINLVTRKYHYRAINVVSHSMGNLEFANYLLRFRNEKRFPQVKHWASMAGNYDGIVGVNDEPNRTQIDPQTGRLNRMEPEYRALLGLRNTFPRETRVLNIFGNLEDGSNSDGDVTNASDRSLRYLINGRSKSYRELMIRGRGGQHSRLHNNAQVNRVLIRFIWQ